MSKNNLDKHTLVFNPNTSKKLFVLTDGIIFEAMLSDSSDHYGLYPVEDRGDVTKIQTRAFHWLRATLDKMTTNNRRAIINRMRIKK